MNVLKSLAIGLVLLLAAIFVPDLKIPEEIFFPTESPTASPEPSPTANVSSPNADSSTSNATSSAKVIRVIDGDTIELEGGIKLRYIGIDTPETRHPTVGVECYGAESSQKNTELVLNKEVRLEKDVSETDRYGRLLRYVYVTTDSGEIFVNQELAKTGFAQARSYPPDIKYQEIFRAAEAEAREKKLGLWGDDCAVQ